MKKILAFIVSLVLMLCFVGCGPKADNKADGENTKNETVVVGYFHSEPMIYKNGRDEIVGFEALLSKKIFEGLNMDVTFKEINPEDVYTELDNGNVDCVWSGFVSNINDADGTKRSDKVDFSYNYMETYQVIVAKTTTGIDNTKPSYLYGKKGVVQAGTSGEIFAKNFQDTNDKNQAFTLDVSSVPTYGDCINEINNETAKFAVLDIHAANIYCGGGDLIEVIPTHNGDTEYFAAAFKKGSELKEKVNAELEKLAKDGSITEIAKKYNAADYVITDFSSQK